MCLNPIRLRTSSLYRSSQGYSKYYVEVPCCNCAECQQRMKNDWYIRNYFESESTWSGNSGYVLFDTLTYDDEHIPTVSKILLGTDINKFSHWSKEIDCLDAFCKINSINDDLRDVISIFRKCNYTCFNYHDIQNFLKLLRIRLERAGFDVDSNLRYFIASEYGHDHFYVDSTGRSRKGTNRPHYHILFYVSGELANKYLTPQLLSLYIGTAWKNGRTDGLPYRDSTYVIKHNTFGPKYITDPNRLRGVQYYVSKYVCKDYDFHSSIDRRLNYILTQLYHISYDSDLYRERKRLLHRYMDQFHRQSLGFGLEGLLNSGALDSILKDGKIRLPDKKKVVREFSIPQYYVRKLFQKCVKDTEGKPHWVWNDLGIQWKKNRIYESIDLLATKMEEWYNNLDLISDSRFNYRKKVSDLLNGRTFKEYAEYIYIYKGRFCINFDSSSSIDSIISSFLSNPFDDTSLFKRLDNGDYEYSGRVYTVDDIESNYILSDTCLGSKYENFDILSDLYRVSLISYNLKKQELYEQSRVLENSIKNSGLYCKNNFK